MLRYKKELPWKLGDGQSQGCPVEKEILCKRLFTVAVIHHGE